jgi:hypothetical protein
MVYRNTGIGSGRGKKAKEPLKNSGQGRLRNERRVPGCKQIRLPKRVKSIPNIPIPIQAFPQNFG